MIRLLTGVLLLLLAGSIVSYWRRVPCNYRVRNSPRVDSTQGTTRIYFVSYIYFLTYSFIRLFMQVILTMKMLLLQRKEADQKRW